MRKVVDCRNTPSLKGCTLAIAGEEDEVLEAEVDHAVKAHGEKDTPELRASIRGSWEDEQDYFRSRVGSYQQPGASAPH